MLRGLDASAGRLAAATGRLDTTQTEVTGLVEVRTRLPSSYCDDSMGPAATMKPDFILTVIACARMA